MFWKRKAVSLVLVLALIASVANADYTFGTPTVIFPAHQYVHGPSVSTDGLTIYVYVQGGSNGWQLYVSTRETIHDNWLEGVLLHPLNSSYDDEDPDISADGLTLFFNSDRPDGYGNHDIWYTTRATTDDPWSEPVNLGPTVNSSANDWGPSVSADGLSLFLGSKRAGGYGDEDIYISTRATINDPWSEPVNLGPIVNSPSEDWSPDISSDGLKLFFSSNRPGVYGITDIYVTRRATVDDPWGMPVNLGPIVNTPTNDHSACISTDGSFLYFYSRPYLRQAPIIPILDFNGDSEVDAQDMSILVDHWHTSDPLCDIAPTPMGDGIVDIQDMIVLSEYLDPGFGRIAHWKLDETEGDIAYDSVGSYHADVFGNAQWQPDAGMLGGALQLDGADDHVAPTLVLNPREGPFRITVWIQGGSPGQLIASQYPDNGVFPTLPYMLADPDDGSLMTQMVLPNAPLDSDIIITDGQWHEVGFEWDGAYRHLYVDGEEAAADDLTLPPLDLSGRLDIGKGMSSQPASFWSGLIDDVRIHIRVVTP